MGGGGGGGGGGGVGFKCQLSVKILAICLLLVNHTQTLIKGPGETSLKYMTHHYKNYGLWSEGRGTFFLAHAMAKEEKCLNHFLDFKITDNLFECHF